VVKGTLNDGKILPLNNLRKIEEPFDLPTIKSHGAVKKDTVKGQASWKNRAVEAKDAKLPVAEKVKSIAKKTKKKVAPASGWKGIEKFVGKNKVPLAVGGLGAAMLYGMHKKNQKENVMA
jgi:hypothetical protein